MLELVAIWVVLMALCFALVRSRRGEGTLLLAYFFGLSLIHVPGAVNYLGSVARLAGMGESLLGFRATLVGMGALLVGAYAIRLALPDNPAPARPAAERADINLVLWKAGLILLIFGVLTSFVLLPYLSFIPSVNSLASVVVLLLVIGYWMLLQSAMNQGRQRVIVVLLAAMPAMPLATLLFGGFAGFGITWAIMVASFYLCRARKVAALLVAAPFVAWLGVSLAVSYFEQRKQIREAVWIQQSSIDVRLEKIGQIASGFELYDFNNFDHVYHIDRRLNQNFIVGRGIERHQAGMVQLFHGSTVNPLVLVPRAIWPEKPAVGGGGTVVSEFTGLQFDESTSVGVGQMLEFYANFGWYGLIFGSLALGGLLAWCDRGLAFGFRAMNIRQILVFGLPGVALVQPGGNLMEIIVAVAAAMIMARVVHAAIVRWLRSEYPGRRKSIPA